MSIPIAKTHSFRTKDKLWNALVTKSARRGMRVSEAIVEALEDWMAKEMTPVLKSTEDKAS